QFYLYVHDYFLNILLSQPTSFSSFSSSSSSSNTSILLLLVSVSCCCWFNNFINSVLLLRSFCISLCKYVICSFNSLIYSVCAPLSSLCVSFSIMLRTCSARLISCSSSSCFN